MSAVTSLSQQSQLADDAYLSLTGAIRGKGGLRSSLDAHGREESGRECFAEQAWGFGSRAHAANEYEQ